MHMKKAMLALLTALIMTSLALAEGLVFPGVGPEEGSMCLNWRLPGQAAPEAALFIWQEGDEAPMRIEAEEIHESGENSVYRAGIDGLLPDTRYYYGFSGEMQPAGSFRTGNAADGVQLLLMADPQLHTYDYEEVCAALDGYLADAAENQDLLVCLGDLASDSADGVVYDGVLSTMAGSGIPSAVIFGNHDMNTSELSDRLNLPNMDRLGYSSRSGSMSGDYWFGCGGVLFLCLNSNEYYAQEHIEFLQKAEAAYRAAYGEPEWRIVMMHHALYNQSEKYYLEEEILALRELLAPVFSEMDIDLVLAGHVHSYSRSYLMKGTEAVPYEGNSVPKQSGETLYLALSTSSGVKCYSQAEQQPYTAFGVQNWKANLTRVSILEGGIRITTFTPENGKTVDEFMLTK